MHGHWAFDKTGVHLPEIYRRLQNVYRVETIEKNTVHRWMKKSEEGKPVPVSYTHLDVYKRQVYVCLFVCVYVCFLLIYLK